MTPPISNTAPLTTDTDTIEDSASVKRAAQAVELLEDLNSLRYLIDDLSDSPFTSKNGAEQSWLYTNFNQTIRSLRSRVRKNIDSLEKEQAKSFVNPKQMKAAITKATRDSHAIKSALRGAYRQRGILLCGQDWQSPVYAASVPFFGNRLSNGIAEHTWDYKRDGHLDAVVYEQQFVKEYAQHLGSQNLKAYLTNSGMAAFSTVMHWLCDETAQAGTALAIQPMYFENLHLSRAFVPNLIQFAPRSSEELLATLRSEDPSIVLFDPITNCGEVVEHDTNAILSWATEEVDHAVTLVIDTTCVPTVMLEQGMLKDLPEHVSVIFVESLAKHHQFGMDTVTGGVILAHLTESMHNSLWKTRARLGTNISDASVGSLPSPNREQLTHRMQRHSRNLAGLANAIESQLDDAPGVIASLSWLKEGIKSDASFHSSCLTVRFQKQCKSIQQYREFENRVLEIAQRTNHPIVFGTSFGFDVSRMYVTAPATRFEEPFLRIAVGTETESEIGTLADIILCASEELADEWSAAPSSSPSAKWNESVNATGSSTKKNSTKGVVRGSSPERNRGSVALKSVSLGENEPGKTAQPVGFIPSVEPRKVNLTQVEKPGLSSTVFTGKDALKNYLSPANYTATPLVELPADLNPFRQYGVRILAKMMPLVPLMNIKSLPAFSMLSEAAKRGDLDDVRNVIESSSSNTVLSLSVMAKLFGIKDTHAIVDHSIAASLLRMLRLFGIEIFKHPAAGHKLFGKMQPRSERATDMGSRPGWFNPGQYSNPDNPRGFAQWLAPDLWAQTQGKLDILSCGLGTCGTMFGVTRELRKLNSDLAVVACCPAAGEAVPGPREQSLLGDVTFDWQGLVPTGMHVSAQESFAASVKLLRRGILGGPSSGMNYAGLLKHLENQREQGLLQLSDSAENDTWCVFLCCDSPLPHVAEYFETLGDDFFPCVHEVPEENEHVSHS